VRGFYARAFLRNMQVSMNHGLGILALVDSSADFTGASFSGDSGGMIVCDSRSWIVSDIPKGEHSSSAPCRLPNLGNRRLQAFYFAKPDFTLQRSMQQPWLPRWHAASADEQPSASPRVEAGGRKSRP